MSEATELLQELKRWQGRLQNLVGGEWVETKKYADVIDPLRGGVLLQSPRTEVSEFHSFMESFRTCPKSGLHNPFKNVDRYLMLGEVCFRAASLLNDEKVADYFARLIQKVMPKSYAQCLGEVVVVRQFLKNFGGDRVRFLARGIIDPGDHAGQQPQHFPWPFGPCVLIAPFNFPLEIPALQAMGGLFMGNRLLVKPDERVSLVMEQFVRLLHFCGLSKMDMDLIHCDGEQMEHLLRALKKDVRLIQFTGSSAIAERLAELFHGRLKIEDSGFDWKILGPDIPKSELDYVLWQCDQDAYGASGQKCSAQSILFLPESEGMVWVKRLAELAGKRNLKDLTIGPILTWDNDAMLQRVQRLLEIPGSELLFGGKALTDHEIPSDYGAIEPTAVYVPLAQIMTSSWFRLVTSEIFGPVQVVTTYNDGYPNPVLEICEKMDNHLTAAVVSNDPVFVNKVLGATVNGTTYVGMRARTTGAPQNHWFGPAGDPRAAGIGTAESVIGTWSSPRCIVRDNGPLPPSDTLQQS